MITIQRNPYTNPINRFDVNGDRFVSAIDVLQVVNYINSGLPARPPIPPTVVPPFLDVDSDGFIGPLDALAVINYINSRISGGGGGGEGEGGGDGSMWISASSVAAPSIGSATGRSQIESAATASASTNGLAGPSNLSLDHFLASLGRQEIGPMLADDSIELVSATTRSQAQDDGDAALTTALEEALGDLL
jgi:hypothetical protein